LAANGYGQQQFNANEQLVKQAAAQASQDPAIAHAVLSLQTLAAINRQQSQTQQQPQQ